MLKKDTFVNRVVAVLAREGCIELDEHEQPEIVCAECGEQKDCCVCFCYYHDEPLIPGRPCTQCVCVDCGRPNFWTYENQHEQFCVCRHPD